MLVDESRFSLSAGVIANEQTKCQFVTTNPCSQVVWFDRRIQGMRGRPKDLIADCMAMAVVDCFEVIDVDQPAQHGPIIARCR